MTWNKSHCKVASGSEVKIVSGQQPDSGVILKACINIMSGKFIQIFSHAINHSHCRYRSKLITAEVTTFHLVTCQSPFHC